MSSELKRYPPRGLKPPPPGKDPVWLIVGSDQGIGKILYKKYGLTEHPRIIVEGKLPYTDIRYRVSIDDLFGRMEEVLGHRLDVFINCAPTSGTEFSYLVSKADTYMGDDGLLMNLDGKEEKDLKEICEFIDNYIEENNV